MIIYLRVELKVIAFRLYSKYKSLVKLHFWPPSAMSHLIIIGSAPASPMLFTKKSQIMKDEGCLTWTPSRVFIKVFTKFICYLSVCSQKSGTAISKEHLSVAAFIPQVPAYCDYLCDCDLLWFLEPSDIKEGKNVLKK